MDTLSLALSTQGIFAAVRVESGDGKSWTQIKSDGLSLGGPITVDMKTGRIKAIGIFLGDCDGHQCIEGIAHPLLGSVHFGDEGVYGNTIYPPEVEGQTSFVLQTSVLGVSTTGIAVPGFGDAIIKRCNAVLKSGGSIHKEHSFTHTVPMTLGADTRSIQSSLSNMGSLTETIVLGNKPLEDVDFSKTIQVELPVICESVPLTPGAGAPGQVGTQLPEYKLLGATLHGDPAQYAGACPMQIKLFMSVTSNVPGPFVARVEAKSGWVSTPYNSQTSESAQGGTWSRHFQDSMSVPVMYAVKPSDGGAKDAAKGIGNVKANPKSEEPIVPPGLPKGPKQVQAGYNPGNLHEDSLRLVVKSGDQSVTTDWWKYSVTCDPKKAKVTDGAPAGLKQAVFIQQAFLALFPSATKDGAKCGITVSGNIQTNVKNASVMFRLKNHQGNTTNAQTIKTTHANNIGKFVEYLDFSKSGHGSWIVPGGGWSMPGAGAGSQAGKKTGTLQIVVENPATFEGNVASYDFTCYDPVPVGLQQPPTVKVDPKIPRTPGAIIGKGNKTTAQPEKQIVPPVICVGGAVRNGQCTCAAGKTPKVAEYAVSGSNAPRWRCEAVSPAVVKPKPIRVTPQLKVVCTGGSVRNDSCVCRAGYAPVKTGTTSYRCQRVAVLPPPVVTPKPSPPTRVIAPAIGCAGGTVRSNVCVCPRGTTLQTGVCRAATSVPLRSGATPQRVR